MASFTFFDKYYRFNFSSIYDGNLHQYDAMAGQLSIGACIGAESESTSISIFSLGFHQ